jgi:hypothetical protein
MARRAGAYVVVVAADNAAECYMKSLGPKRDWYANYAMTLDRKGENLALFFRSLFEAMFTGQSMLLAWVKLAPQGGRVVPSAPEVIMDAEAGHMTFSAELSLETDRER